MRMRSIARATPLLALLALTVSSAACGTSSSSGFGTTVGCAAG